jgi:hypothetical protein
MDSDSFIPQFWRASRLIGVISVVAKAIETQGLKLPEGSGKAQRANEIQWVDPLGKAKEILVGFTPGVGKLATLTLEAFPSSVYRAYVTITGAENEEEIGSSKVEVSAGKLTKLILDALGRSDFIQVPASFEKKLIRTDFGSADNVFPGGVSFHDIEIEHNLGNTPKAIVATNSSLVSGLWEVVCDIGARSKTKFTVRQTFITGFAPPAGTRLTVDWMTMG